jgi:hypothetical protein
MFGYDDNFEKIIARLPDLLGVQQAQLGKCTVTQLRDVCEQAGIDPVPAEPDALIPTILAFRNAEGKRRRAKKNATTAPAAVPAAIPAAAPALAPSAAPARRGAAAAGPAAAANRVAHVQTAQAPLIPLQSQP